MVQTSTFRSVGLFEHNIKLLVEVVVHRENFSDQTFNFENALNNNLGFHVKQNVPSKEIINQSCVMKNISGFGSS